MLPRLQEIILLKIYTLGPRCRIADIRNQLTEDLGEEQEWSTIDTTVKRLVKKGSVTCEPEALKPKRQRQTMLYSVSPAGLIELQRSIQMTQSVYGSLLTDPGYLERLVHAGPGPEIQPVHA